METVQGNMLLSLRNAKGFLEANAAQLAGVVTTGTKQELDEAIVELEMHVSNQGNTFIAAKGSTQKQRWLRSILLRNHMAPINRVAQLKLGDTPELAPFLMPRGKPTTERLAGLANGMADAAIPFTATFIAAGLPADFVPQLKSVVVQMVQSLSDRSLTHGKRKGATTSLKGVLTRGRKIVSVLDAFVRNALEDESTLLANWNLVKRVPNARVRTRGAQPAAAQPAVAAAPPAAAAA